MRFAATTCLALVAIAGLAAAPAAAGACPYAKAKPRSATVAQLRAATECLIDRRRARQGRRTTRSNGDLRRAAVRHTKDMVRHRFFSHTGSDGSDVRRRVRRTGYPRGSWSAGEVIAWGLRRGGSPASIVRGWMRSSGHRRILLTGRFRDIGIGVVRRAPNGSRSGATYTAVLAHR